MAPRLTPTPSAAPDAAPTGFDAVVHVPQGSSVDAAITAAEEADESTSGFAVASLTDTPTFEAGEAAFPRIRLAQGLTSEVAEGTARMGQWLFPGYDPADVITVIPIKFGRARNKRENPDDRESAVACSSSDGVQGVGVPGRACKGCPFAQFTTDPKSGRRKSPACTLTYTYAVWCPDFESFAEVSFSRTSEQAAHLINNFIVFRGLGNFAVRLTTTLVRGRNTYAVPQVRMTEVSPEMVDGVAGLFGIAVVDVPALPAGSAD